MSISSTLIRWYLEKKRELPWRTTQNPYHIWVSEVILQQTRVAQGIDYYHRFLEKFPSIDSLASSQPDEVMKVWQGLGYYSRARNLQAGAKEVVARFEGKLPADYNSLLSIKGIGSYTAAAIASFAFHLPEAVVDGNVNRVLARLFGIFDPVNSTRGAKQITQKAYEILDLQNPALHNQAIMEFGALQCTKHALACECCPLLHRCFAWQHQQVTELPQKVQKKPQRIRYFNYLVYLTSNGFYLVKRANRDIWEGLYEFPLIETGQPSDFETLRTQVNGRHALLTPNVQLMDASPVYIHQLSHQTIHARFYLLAGDPILEEQPMIFCSKSDVSSFPVHKLIDNYLNMKLA